MIPYLILLTSVVLVAFFSFQGYFEDKLNLLQNTFCIVLILFCGLASSRGDFEAYLFAYSDGFGPTFEPAINIIGKICKYFGFSVYSVFIVFAAISFTIKFSFFKQASSQYFFLVLAFYISAFMVSCEMGAIRFGTSLAFVLYSIKFIEERDVYKFSLIIIIASLFHLTAISVFLIYFLRGLKNLKTALIFFLLLSISFSFIQVSFFTNIINTIFPQSIFFTKYINYFNEPAYFTPAFFKRILILFAIIYFYKDLVLKQKWFKTLFIFYFCSTCFFLMFKLNHTAASRMSYLFSSVEPVLLSALVLITQNNKIKFFIATTTLVYAYINLITSLNSQTDFYNKYLPYKLYFQ